ncbi:hypothetical protein [Alteribacter keqinensis]|uniref:ABC transporter permease n=1 Tax=Alteribacter keqinensis TaxID=2483800 RepID=A0A3M7TSG6_9BACI|nr:hypothetical protein [Alteribacter keqinensis]RNA68588.1 hypothetical protein EBO34_01050 [Alteribacter keqinensis]
MSLTAVSFWSVVKKQYWFKVKAYKNAFSTLVILQLLAILFSMNGTSQMGSGSEMVYVSVTHYTSSVVIIFSMIWCFITAILITTKAYKNDDFAFVTNRLSGNAANVLFLLTASVIAGITASLSGYAIRISAFFIHGVEYMGAESMLQNPLEVLMGTAAAVLYIFLLGSLGYLLGNLSQINRVFTFLVPVIFFGFAFTGGGSEGGVLAQIVTFFSGESSFLLFMLKAIIVSTALYSLTSWLTNKMEVRLS